MNIIIPIPRGKGCCCIIPVMLALMTTSVLLLLPLWRQFAKPSVHRLGNA